MKKFIQNHKLALIGTFLGGIVGYLYWQQIGCSTGTCPLTSKPLNSTLYFAFLGYIFSGFFSAKKSVNSK
ncbi:hypothetical protein G9H64_03590 [Aquirufa nivalisilvae]|uniref:Uncharacterized protein n=1 Tax=Aquirufa nivalisilvae TaxID=2516557 RepID=A0A2S2DU26_9BACT|nr:DUF6132 family protein [Aquirufa nivalisilvae]AWL08914.1 hypothetical protein HME7025_01050 [Aquirufa nivalisilvae]MCZ2481140.1 hypothetical protein [Aquirufa nivalisilvae]MCZ2482031.1 hypothetical protein [Aquirufa nivalisilvae]TBH73447.1 hypothetical protein EWU22_07150 [Aquirufa nivalisilvae]